MAKRAPILTRGSWLRRGGELAVADRLKLAGSLEEHELAALGSWYWEGWARDAQLPPDTIRGDGWRIWLIMAGRGFGKTRAGAEWVRDVARHDGAARIALVAASLAEARSVMVEGESGILAAAPGALAPEYEPSLRRLQWENGAQAFLYSAAEPDSLRGPQHSHAWCDELAKWDNAGDRAIAAWDNLQLTMRLGESPRIVATTTPRAVQLMRRVMAAALRGEVAVARGKTEDNAAVLPSEFFTAMIAQYEATSFGRQELDGELLEEAEGALWSRKLLDACRVEGVIVEARRVVVGVDPPASATGDACGIVVVELGVDGGAVVRADCSVEKVSPERWARAVADAAREWRADRVVAEKNQGGDMVRTVLRAADISLPLKLVHASRAKAARAEPVAALYENGRVRHAGVFKPLEDQMCGLMAGGGYTGPGRSPDRADALVWALTELMLEKPRAEPRVRGL